MKNKENVETLVNQEVKSTLESDHLVYTQPLEFLRTVPGLTNELQVPEKQNQILKDMDSKTSSLKNSWLNPLAIFEMKGGKIAWLEKYTEKSLLQGLEGLSKEACEKLSTPNHPARKAFLEALYSGICIFECTANADQANLDDYTQKFKKQIKILEENLGVEALEKLLCATSEKIDFLSILPLTYQKIQRDDAIIREFSDAEVFGHYVPYQVEKKNLKKSFEIKHADGTHLSRYQIKPIEVMKKQANGKSSRDMGVMGSILTSDTLATDEEPVLHICWKGTDSGATVKADVEAAAGAESYRRGEDQILKQIASAIDECQQVLQKNGSSKKLKIMVSGHSLGGALSQQCFNSLQRILAKDLIKNNENNEVLRERITTIDNRLITGLENATAKANHQKELSDININYHNISELSLNVANAAGVLPAVQQASNEFAAVLSDAGVKHSANFLKISGDVVGVTGAGILNDIPNNKAKVNIMHINLPTTGAKMTALGIIGAIPVSLVLAGTGPLGIAFAGVVSTAVAVRALQAKAVAHTQYQFKQADRPANQYDLWCSHSLEGQVNTAQCQKIQQQLSNQSLMITLGSAAISWLRSSNLRNDSKLGIEFRRIKTAIEQCSEDDSKFRSTLSDELFKAVNEDNVDLLRKLLEMPGIDVNALGSRGLSPLEAFIGEIENTSIFKRSFINYHAATELLKAPNIEASNANKQWLTLASGGLANRITGASTEFGRQLALVSEAEKTAEAKEKPAEIETLIKEERQLLNEIDRVFENQDIKQLQGFEEKLKECREDFKKLEYDLEQLRPLSQDVQKNGDLIAHLIKIKTELEDANRHYAELEPMLSKTDTLKSFTRVMDTIPGIIKAHQSIYDKEVAAVEKRARKP